MGNPASIRESSLKFLALWLAFHLLLSTLPFLASARPKVSTAQTKIKYYPAALYFPGGSRAKWAPQPPGGKRHPVADHRKMTSDLALGAKPAPAAGRPVAAMHEPVPGSGSDAE